MVETLTKGPALQGELLKELQTCGYSEFLSKVVLAMLRLVPKTRPDCASTYNIMLPILELVQMLETGQIEETDSNIELVKNKKKRIYLGNMAEKEVSNNYKWVAFIREEDGSQDIQRVVYYLHKTFSPSIIILDNPPWTVTRIGWGTFEIRAEVTFKPETKLKKQLIRHNLNFTREESETEHLCQYMQ